MAEEKKTSMYDYVNAGFVALGMAMGEKVGLFDALIKLSEDGSWKTTEEIAAAAKLKE
uniref:Uncharacterized protein n=1 Tax=Plectus sambesii TaxID=2011161 RepID=A0A914UY93_9BILA